MSKKLEAAIAVVVVLAIGGAAVAFAVSNSNVTDVELAEVTTEDLAVSVAASGEVEADSRVDVYPPTAGTLASIEVEEGDEVSAGQVLAIMDTAPIEIQVAQAEAAYKGAVAQRNAITNSAPGAADLRAAQAAVDAAWSAYSAANAAYEAALAGVGGATESDLAEARALVAVLKLAADTAQDAYDRFYNDVYLPAPLPRDPELETGLTNLGLTRDLAVAELHDAERAVAALESLGSVNPSAASAKMARDQAYAAYLGAVAQRDALTRASSVGGALASANAAVAAAEAALDYANDTLDRAEIVAPVGGVVLFSSSSGASLLAGASLGGALGGGTGSGSSTGLSVGSSVSPASPPFTIVSFDTLAFTAQVDEADVTRIEPGMESVISLDGIADREFTAEVDRIGKEAVVTPTGGTAFPVHLRFEADGATVLLGMNGSVEIRVETIGNTTTMPVEALLEDGDTSYVYTVENGRAHRTEIEVGRMTDTRVEILAGLSEGDQVIVSGVASLADGDRVRAK